MQPRSSRKVPGWMGGFLQMTLMTMMNSIIEINSSSDSDEEKEQAGGGFVYHKGTDCKLRGAVPAYSAIEPGDDGSLSAWYEWSSEFQDWCEDNGMTSLLQEGSYGCPVEGKDSTPPEQPVAPDVPKLLGPRPTVQEDPSASKEGEELALEVKKAQELWDSKSEKIMKEYKADVEKYSMEVANIAPLSYSNSQLRKYRRWRSKQKALRSQLRKAVRKNATLSAAVKMVDPTEKASGSLTYFAIVKEVLQLFDEDIVDNTQQQVIGRIHQLKDSEAVKGFITEYRLFYLNEWCKLFIATPSDPEPWTKRVPESLIVGSIEKALPLTPEWDTFRMSVTAKDESLISYMGLVQSKCNRILRARQGTTPNAAMQSGDQGKQLTGPQFDCFMCKESGVPAGAQRQHKPNWPGCKHHKEYMAARKRKKKRTRGTGRKNKSGPSKDHPCAICKSPDHWAKDCPDKDKSDNGDVEEAGTDVAAIATTVTEAVTAALQPFLAVVQQQHQMMMAVMPNRPPHGAGAGWGSQPTMRALPYGGAASGNGGGANQYFAPAPNNQPPGGP